MKSPYRNSLRSKKMIKVAFLQLLSQKEITKIKVKEITDLADLSKGTFYAHFRDIYAVLEEIENENIDNMVFFLNTQQSDHLIDDFSPFLREIFSHIDDNKEFYQVLFNSHMANSFSNKLQQIFVEYMMSNKKIIEKLNSETEAKMFFSFIAIGTANLIKEVLTSTTNTSLNKWIETLNSCIINGISAIKKGN